MDIDFEKTLQKGRLVFKSYYEEKVSPVISYILYTAFILVLLYFLYTLRENESELAKLPMIAFVAVFSFISVYSLYVEAHERKLFRIETKISKGDVHDRIKDIIKENKDWKAVIINEDYLIGRPKSSFISPGRQITILFLDDYILVNVLGNSYRGFTGPYLYDFDWLKEKLSQHRNPTS